MFQSISIYPSCIFKKCFNKKSKISPQKYIQKVIYASTISYEEENPSIMTKMKYEEHSSNIQRTENLVQPIMEEKFFHPHVQSHEIHMSKTLYIPSPSASLFLIQNQLTYLIHGIYVECGSYENFVGVFLCTPASSKALEGQNLFYQKFPQ